MEQDNLKIDIYTQLCEKYGKMTKQQLLIELVNIKFDLYWENYHKNVRKWK